MAIDIEKELINEKWAKCSQCGLKCKRGKEFCYACNPTRVQAHREKIKQYMKSDKGKIANKKAQQNYYKRRAEAEKLLKEGKKQKVEEPIKPEINLLDNIESIEPIIEDSETEEEEMEEY